jgi:DNA-binding GntR family transcriptional regulator
MTLARDADRAADALAQHIERTAVALVRYAEARDDGAAMSA